MFQNKLKELRERAGFTSQQAFANALGVRQSTVGNWESGTRVPDLKMLRKIADVLNASVAELIEEDSAHPLCTVKEGVMVSIQNSDDIEKFLGYQYQCSSAVINAILKDVDKENKLSALSKFFEVDVNDLRKGRFPLRTKQSVFEKIDQIQGIDTMLRRHRLKAENSLELTDDEQDLIYAYQHALPQDRQIIDNIVHRYPRAESAEHLA